MPPGARSGVRTLDSPFAGRLSAPLAATAQLDEAAHFDALKPRMLDRFSPFALFAANQALDGLQSALAGVDRCRAAVALPTMHLALPDVQCAPDCVANCVASCVRAGVHARTMLSNSFAFGGSNAVLVLGAVD